VNIEDFFLIRKIQNGNTKAFDFLVQKYYKSVYEYCYRKFNGNADLAADLTQDVFLRLLQNIHTVKKVGKFKNFLFTIATNICNNYYKKSKPLYMDIETLNIADQIPEPLEKIIFKEEACKIQKAIAQLPDFQKEAIILRYYHDMKLKDIAQITNVSVPTVKSRLKQGLEKLRRYIKNF